MSDCVVLTTETSRRSPAAVEIGDRMPHVTMIHGIGNKREADRLLASWEYALRDGGLDLAGNGVTTSMVYWADVLYEAPSSGESHESTGDEVLTSDLDEDMQWLDELSPEDRAFVDSLQREYAPDMAPPEGYDDSYAPPEAEQDGTYERIPIPWFIKRRMMNALLRDVHHYLFNATTEPRPGEVFQVQDEIRGRFVNELRRAGDSDPTGPHIVVSHSMGTVIAYDCLKRVAECPQIDALMTIGSPLGIDEIQDMMKPEWTRDDGYPSLKVDSGWTNVYDSLDVVSRLDPVIANDYRRSGTEVIADVEVENSGLWRHDISQYLRRPGVQEALALQLGL